ncbi:MAG TPA: Type 1 glutamine amidotransferase-like domain-containing protein [Actinomycetota bacterium]|nr:Type 1 glutamine amidotransferase-like domain-containing protein [Actinomycetota bacterium]
MGGDELHPGNEDQDRVLVAAAGGGPAYVVATAAARHRPELAVANARRWFGSLGLDVEELPATTKRHARSTEIAERARAGRFFYLVGGDPGIVPDVLAGSPVWEAIVAAWRAGAALGGSSAGAMALGAWTLIRDRVPGDDRRRYRPALDLVPRLAVVPHLETFGGRWVDGALAAMPMPDAILLGLGERTAALHADGAWRAFGPGAVEVITAAGRRSFAAGDAIEGLPAPG